MGYIYCITNNINGKQYVGKTIYSVTKRFKEHRRDCKKRGLEKRPLYSAMNKYGIENFSVSILIECDECELSSYEIMFIDKLDTYKNGYNATKGGDGKILFDYKEIINLYNSGLNIVEISAKLGCCTKTVSTILHKFDISIRRPVGGNEKPKVPVRMLDKETGIEIKTFDSIANASRWLYSEGKAKRISGGIRQKISMCAKGKLKSAYGFKWEIL